MRGPGGRASGGISVGGSVSGSALNTGDFVHQSVTFDATDATVAAALGDVRAALAGLTGPRTASALREIDAATEAAGKPAPDKAAVGGALQTALETASKAADFAQVAARLAPPLQSLVGWLGGEWAHLIQLLG